MEAVAAATERFRRLLLAKTCFRKYVGLSVCPNVCLSVCLFVTPLEPTVLIGMI